MDLQSVIKQIGRGKLHARHLETLDARQLYRAMLNDEVDPLSLGAILIALRMKGEGEGEMLGFCQALQEQLPHWPAPQGKPLPIVIPSYNGARREANLTPLLALLLQRCGLAVFVHTIHHDATRITSAEIFRGYGFPPATSVEQGRDQLQRGELCWMTIDNLCPSLAKQLDLRWQLGLRNSAHSLAKLISPFQPGAALLLTSVSHPEYLAKVKTLLQQQGHKALLMQGCEGEVYANPQRLPEIYAIDSQVITLTNKQSYEAHNLPRSKSCDDTLAWMQQVLNHQIPVPEALRQQIACCLVASGAELSLQQAFARMVSQGL